MTKTRSIVTNMIPLLKTAWPGVTKKDLASRLDISIKSVGRYLTDLREMGFKLVETDGKTKHWRIEDDGRGITEDDVRMIETIQDELKRQGNLLHEDRLCYLREKLEQLRLRDESDETQPADTSKRFQFILSQGMDYEEDKAKISRLHRAITKNEAVKLEYRKLNSETCECKIHNPLALANRMGRLYLIAQSPRHPERIYNLAVTRINRISSTSNKFTVPEGFSVEEYFKDSMTTWHSNEPPIHLVMRVRNLWILEYLKEIPLHTSKRLEKAGPDEWYLHLDITWGEDVQTWILGFANFLEVMEPVAIRSKIATAGRRIAEMYEKKKS